MNRSLLQLLILAVAVLIVGDDAFANPTGKKPNLPLAVHGTIEGAKEEAARLYELYGQYERAIIEADKLKANPKKIPAVQLAKLHVLSWKAARDAHHLSLMGEPAGDDLMTRFNLIQRASKDLCNAFQRTPEGGKLAEQVSQQLQRQTLELDKFLQRAEKVVDEGEWSGIAERMETLASQLLQGSVLLGDDEQDRYWSSIALLMKRGDASLNQLRQEEYAEIAEVEFEKQFEAISDFLVEANRIRDQIAADGKASLSEGVEGDAAEAFAHIVKLWGEASVGFYRAVALRWAFTNRPSVAIKKSPTMLRAEAITVLVMLIDAAATSSKPDEVPQLYSRLLEQVTIADRRTGKRVGLMVQCKPALDRLATKKFQLEKQLAAYRLATQEPLAWRRKFADQRAQHLSKGYTALRKILYAKHQVDPNLRPEFGRLQGAASSVAPGALTAPAHWVVQDTALGLTKASVTIGSTLRLKPSSRTVLASLRNHCYVNSSVPKPPPAQLADLRTALIVDDDHGPLSLEAADAVSSAELHDYLTIGGVISDVQLESVVTRMVTLPGAAYFLIPLGQTFSLPHLCVPHKQICWRLKIESAWVRHEYFAARVTDE